MSTKQSTTKPNYAGSRIESVSSSGKRTVSNEEDNPETLPENVASGSKSSSFMDFFSRRSHSTVAKKDSKFLKKNPELTASQKEINSLTKILKNSLNINDLSNMNRLELETLLVTVNQDYITKLINFCFDEFIFENFELDNFFGNIKYNLGKELIEIVGNFLDNLERKEDESLNNFNSAINSTSSNSSNVQLSPTRVGSLKARSRKSLEQRNVNEDFLDVYKNYYIVQILLLILYSPVKANSKYDQILNDSLYSGINDLVCFGMAQSG